MTNYYRNTLGGIEDRSPEALKRAEKVDLITYPRNITGSNCFNCKYIEDKSSGIGYCRHPEVKQYVSVRMCCGKWDKAGTRRAWEGKD